MGSISSLHYSLDPTKNLNWTVTQEKSISRDYPFVDLHDETADQYVVRTYLQFLWLPESIMPLDLLIPSLQRVNVASSSEQSSSMPHPLHALLEPLLLTARSAANKYHVELPQILSDGGGAGEIEETMMWFALNNEKFDEEDDRTRPNANIHAEGPWVDERWRKRWMERMERREVQIQVILHFLKLSLPGPSPLSAAPNSPSPKKRKRSAYKEPKVVVPSAEDRLESFMDKLSMWQLMGGLDPATGRTSMKNGVDERDWMQSFCEGIIEPQFKPRLPDLSALLRTKIFPNSPFSEDSSSRSSTRSPSPETLNHPNKHARSSSATSRLSPYPHPHDSGATRHSSPALSTASTSRAGSAAPADTTVSSSRPLARSRSRSLSVSLAQEERERAESVGVPSKKRVLNREVSMSRVFKGKDKVGGAKGKDKDKNNDSKEQAKGGERRGAKPKGTKDEGVLLVAATPVKPIAKSRSISRVPSVAGPTANVGGGLFGFQAKGKEQQAEEEIWNIPSTPDVVFLGAGGGNSHSDGESNILVVATPSKKLAVKRSVK